MKKLWDLKKLFSNLEPEGQGRGIIMGVTRLLLLGLFYTIQTKRDQTICTRVYNKNHTRVSVANYFFLLYFFLWFSLMHYNDLIYKFLLLWEICYNSQLFKKFSLIKYLLLFYLGFSGWNTGLVQLHSWRNIAGSKHNLVYYFFCTFFFDFH